MPATAELCLCTSKDVANNNDAGSDGEEGQSPVLYVDKRGLT
jgi:hypothetical protein